MLYKTSTRFSKTKNKQTKKKNPTYFYKKTTLGSIGFNWIMETHFICITKLSSNHTSGQQEGNNLFY